MIQTTCVEALKKLKKCIQFAREGGSAGPRVGFGVMGMSAKNSAIACTAMLLLAGCGGGVQLDPNSSAVRVAQTLPEPDAPEAARNLDSYRLGARDVITVSVFGAPELEREGSIDLAGNFSMPLAGSIAAAGKTPDELASAIEEKLRGRYLRDPQVAVNIKEVKAQTVTVDGEVREPGLYPVIGRMTLQQAIATARGASDTASLRNVIVFRTVDGQKMAAMFDLKDIRSGRAVDPDIFANDIVVVGQNATLKAIKDFSLGFPVLGSFIPVIGR
jgi:polysaccharide export outer membrane protein